MKLYIFRSVWLPALITTVLLLIALAMLGMISWRDFHRLQPMQTHLNLVNDLQRTGLELQQMLVDSLARGKPVPPDELQRLRQDFLGIQNRPGYLAEKTPAQIARVAKLLAEGNPPPRSALVETLHQLHLMLDAESDAHDDLFRHIQHDTRIEFEVATAIMIGFPLLALLTIFFLRNRILLPLRNLRSLMAMLAQRDYSSALVGKVDPMLVPLFENYNHMVTQLATYEVGHQKRQLTLENEVRAATQTLLEQQRNLANAERLALVGEVAAGLAHELRNPLAGMQMALGNLRRDVTDADQADRLDMVIAELRRVIRLLNDLLDQAKQAPEAPKDLNLMQEVDELFALARYQIPPQIVLENQVDQDLHCRLPEDHLHQALLNLLLNAAQSVGNKVGWIHISAQKSDDKLLISVCDNGPGFPQELLDIGVRPFLTGRESGTGLGLAMVRRFASDLGGSLKLKNREEGGACVELHFPYKESPNG